MALGRAAGQELAGRPQPPPAGSALRRADSLISGFGCCRPSRLTDVRRPIFVSLKNDLKLFKQSKNSFKALVGGKYSISN